MFKKLLASELRFVYNYSRLLFDVIFRLDFLPVRGGFSIAAKIHLYFVSISEYNICER